MKRPKRINDMKTKVMLTYLFSFFALAGFAQSVENDDLYFTSKDRAKLKELQGKEEAYASVKKRDKKNQDEAYNEDANPTDSYSARNVNPEYAARSNAQSAQSDNADYFVNDYRYSTASNLNNWNNNFNNWYGDRWYTGNYYGPSINSWNSPYYGYNSPYSSPWYDPYWNYNGWSTSFSYHYGNSWNYGWGGNYNYWNRPYCGYASSWNPYFGNGFNSGYGYYGNSYYGRPGNVIIVNNNYGGEAQGRTVTTGKRPSRSTVMGNENNISRSRNDYNVGGGRNDVSNSGGRIATPSNATNTRRQDEYYNRSWKYTAPANNGTATRSSSFGDDNNTRQNTWNNSNSNSSWNNNNSNSNSSFGRSSDSGTRTQSAPSSGSNGRTRGRD
jgi:hypothetical protein